MCRILIERLILLSVIIFFIHSREGIGKESCTEPDWYSEPAKLAGSKGHLGTGVAESFEEARNQALADMARSISSFVSSSVTAKANFGYLRGKNIDSSEIEDSIAVETQLVLRGYELVRKVEICGKHYVLFRISEAKANSLLKKQDLFMERVKKRLETRINESEEKVSRIESVLEIQRQENAALAELVKKLSSSQNQPSPELPASEANPALNYFSENMGSSIPTDKQQPLMRLIEHAFSGDPESMHLLGIGFLYGKFLKYRPNEATRWLRKAAAAGYSLAELDLGEAYRLNERVRNYSKAAFWYKKAAARGDVTANRELGHLYKIGNGVEQNLETAERLMLVAATAGDAEANYLLSEIYSYKASKAQERTASPETGKFLRLSFKHLERAADNNYLDSKPRLANLLGRGLGTKKDVSRAESLLRESANKGVVNAMVSLADLLKDEALLAKAENEIEKANQLNHEAQAWLEKAANLGDTEAMVTLAWNSYRSALRSRHIERNGRDTGEDIKRALYWAKRGADKGNKQAHYFLGQMYQDGIEVEKDLSAAVEHYVKALDEEDGASEKLRDICFSNETKSNCGSEIVSKLFNAEKDLGSNKLDPGFVPVEKQKPPFDPDAYLRKKGGK